MSNEMAAGDFPQISQFNYGGSNTNVLDQFLLSNPSFIDNTNQMRRMQAFEWQNAPQQFQATIKKTTPMPESSRRIAQVFIADPHPDVPLSDALLYKTEPQFTDASDQELYFESPVMERLKSHNEKRVKWLDKESTKRAGKDVFLDPIKVRDLRMVVVTIAQF